jgi:hypothetical protein
MRAFLRLYLPLMAVWGVVLTAIYTVVHRPPTAEYHVFVVFVEPGGSSIELRGWNLALLVSVLLLVPPAAGAAAVIGLQRIAKRMRRADA